MNREKEIVKTSMVGIGGNVLLVIAKAIVGFIAGSISIILDALNNLTDALSSLITLIGTKLSNKKPDKKHPYGYGRIEYITSILIAALVLFAGGSALYESIQNIIASIKKTAEVNYTYVTIIVVSIAVVGKVLLGLYFLHQAKKTESANLKASGKDALMDSLLSLATLVAVLVAMFAHVAIEGYLGVVISVFILKTGIEILLDAFGEIIGKRPDHDYIKMIKSEVKAYPEVKGAYDLIINNYGPDRVIASIHIEVRDDMTAKEIHALTRKITTDMYDKHGIILTLGIYASNDTDPEVNKLKERLFQEGRKHPEIIQMHGFYADMEKKVVVFDTIFNYKVKAPTCIVNQVIEEVKKDYPDFTFYPNIDQDFTD
jgi:cation diffusion facilitator family transporter